MPRKKSIVTDPVVEVAVEGAKQVFPDASAQLIAALVEAIKQTKPIEKKNAANYKTRTGYEPKDGSPKLKLKRAHYQHSLPIDPDQLYNEDIDLLNRLKPGRFLNGYVLVSRRRDKGIDITYNIKTASNKLKLVNQFGIRNFRELIARCVEEADNPAKYAVTELD